MGTRVSFTQIKKCKHVDTPNNLYKLNKGSIKQNHYLVVLENDTISFKTIRKVNDQDMPTWTGKPKICCCISWKVGKCLISFAQIDDAYRSCKIDM